MSLALPTNPSLINIFVKLLNGLEEFKSGQHVKKDFSEAEYSNYYKMILNNLREMEVCDDFGPILQEIREDIFDSGW